MISGLKRGLFSHRVPCLLFLGKRQFFANRLRDALPMPQLLVVVVNGTPFCQIDVARFRPVKHCHQVRIGEDILRLHFLDDCSVSHWIEYNADLTRMPRTPEENDRIRRATTEQLLSTALSLFCEKGYYSTSIEDIAKQAEISKGLLYHYFKSKAEVLAALVEIRINDVLIVMNAATTKSTPAKQIRYIAEGALEDVRRQPEVFRFYLNLFTQPRLDPVVAKYTQKLMNEQARQFEVQTELFKALGVENPRMRSLYFSSTLQGIMLMYSTYPKSFPLNQVKAQVMQEFCDNS